jgi:Tol biopolymer transport system component
MAQEFDPGSCTTRGEPRATQEAVHFDRSTWNAPITASANGVLVYGLGGNVGNNRIALYDRSGRRVRNLSPSANILAVNATADGRRVAFEWQQRPLADLWAVDVATGTRSKVTTNPDDDNSPVWMPDGKNIMYAGRTKAKYRIFLVRADGSGEPQQILEDPKLDEWPLDVSADGQ